MLLTLPVLQHAVLMVRPRGWHLPEKHILVDGKPCSGALMDFALFFFNSAHALIKSGSGEHICCVDHVVMCHSSQDAKPELMQTQSKHASSNQGVHRMHG